ncbi:P-loop containing nucleoside triphosphate hydrolase protein [Annulohypoxylon truncatum]|uniref:P-loop containing nucleoside triphosphate hydrolase protein n=1 Tax=Annulohypoxylon truncatum TaxID=327061 RepID=UPI0020081F03|nr:P-loop containing nucleoside triphosphate hydrolase protein [Annulohypoxylon truncatum]KAI1208213.1 P-loop containing nucleoside triphosphate hydrolase protein [Annulohypoxylon truncatum]
MQASPNLFFHSWDGLRGSLQGARGSPEPNQELIDDLKIACDFVEEELKATSGNCLSLMAANEITWPLLWTLMKPNSLVYHYHELVEQHQILRFKGMEMIESRQRPPYWDIKCDIITDDGNRFGLAKEPLPLEIEIFDGARKITDLPVYPLERCPVADKAKEEALARGRFFQGIRPPYFCQTHGFAMSEKSNHPWKPIRFKVRTYGRAMLDAAAFRTFNPNMAFHPIVSRTLERELLTDEQLMITSPVALGFCFGSKQWLGLAMSRLLPIDWNDLAFEQLVLNPRSKKLILSLIKHHSAHDGFDDIVAGKGKGTIFLLSGPPGCGKTLTAEAAAEITKRPLYSVSAGDLGTKADEVEQSLTKILDVARAWDAVLLLDEADVFLQQRKSDDIKRNALVSIFLRQIEYYQGILMLTTNRVDQFDIAFESRIHVSIRYPELDHDARRAVWSTFLNRAGESASNANMRFTEQEKDVLASKEINGRQIKNIVHGALTLAREAGETLDMSHIDNVLSVMNSWKQGEGADALASEQAAAEVVDLLA